MLNLFYAEEKVTWISEFDYSDDEDDIVLNVVLDQINQKLSRNCMISTKKAMQSMFFMRPHFRCAYSVIILEYKMILCSNHTRTDAIYV